MSEFIVCDGCSLKFSDPTVSGDITINSDTGVPPSVLSENVKTDGKNVYNLIGFTIANFSGLGISNGSGAGAIIGTSTKVKADGMAVVLATDSMIVVVTGTNDSPPPPTLAVSVQVEIDDPGQDKVKAI